MPSYPNDGRGRGHYYERDGKQVYQTEALADDAIEFLEKHRAKPFFCVVSMYPPHGPRSVPREFEALYEDRFPKDASRRKYYAMCTAVDAAVGRLLKALEDLQHVEDTVVVYTSEHGQLFDLRWNRHPKRLCYDEAARVPLLMRLPSRLPAAQVSDHPFNAVDMTPSLLGLLALPAGAASFDGHDLSAVLKSSGRHPAGYTVMVNIPYIDKTRARDRVVLTEGEERCIVSGKWKLILSRNRPAELYDLEQDAAEHHNVWPALAASETASLLKRQMTAWAGRVGDRLVPELLAGLPSPSGNR
jgi:arylsulfatase A-like enzyme